MVWQLNKDRALLETESLDASFDLSQPYLGLSLRSRDDSIDVRQLFAFLVPESPVETYVRGADLVNKYPPRNSDLVSYQTYFRPTPEFDGIHFILSAQTSLLESAPLTQVTSSCAPGQVLLDSSEEVRGSTDFDRVAAPSFFLLRPQASDSVSLVLFVHPGDFHRASVRIEPNPSIAFWVFPNSLEKGVIRRATFQLRLIPRTADEATAAQLWETASSATPPLAT